MANPYLKRLENPALANSNGHSHKRAKRQEKEIAKRIGGRLVPRSGAGDIKGDCRLKGILRIEAKTTGNRSFSVTLDMIDKIEEAAVSAGEMPVIVIEFNNNGKRMKEIAVCPTWVLDSICANQQG